MVGGFIIPIEPICGGCTEMTEGSSATAHFNGFVYKFKATVCRIYRPIRAETDSYFHYTNLLAHFTSEPMIMYSNAC